MPWTAPRTWVDGELVDASMMNLHVRDNMTFLVPNPDAVNTPFNAANFTAPGGTWTVDPGDIVAQWLYRIGNRYRYTVRVNTSSLGGALGVQLRVAIPYPGGVTTLRTSTVSTQIVTDGALAFHLGFAFARVGTNYVEVYKRSLAAWVASTNNCYIYFTMPLVTLQ